MASQPEIPAPDTIQPQSPPEVPGDPGPIESPGTEPPGFEPPGPDIDQPGRGPSEVPPPG